MDHVISLLASNAFSEVIPNSCTIIIKQSDKIL